MYHSRGVPWIGFEEAQKAIDALKEEVNLAEKKLSNAKLSLKFDRGISATTVHLKKSPSDVKNAKEEFSHFYMETIPKRLYLPDKDNIKRIKVTVPKGCEVNPTLHDHPKHTPSKVSLSKPTDVKETLVKAVFDSALSKISSSETSDSTSIGKHKILSSERSSSSLDHTYRNIDAELSLRIDRYESAQSNDLSNISFNSWEKEFLKEVSCSDREAGGSSSPHVENANSDIYWATVCHEKVSKRKSNQTIVPHNYEMPLGVPSVENFSNGMQWTPVVSGEKLPKFKQKKSSDGFLALKQIIERQKKFHEESQGRSHSEFLSSIESHPKNEVKQITSADVEAELQMKPPPLRKQCFVSTVPQYRGFSAPGFSAFPNRKKFRPIKKATRYISEIKKTDSGEVDCLDDGFAGSKFQVKHIVIENKKHPKAIDSDPNKEKAFPDSSSSGEISDSSSSSVKDKDNILVKNQPIPEKENTERTDSPAEETFDGKINTSTESTPTKADNILKKEIPKPIFSKSIKRKANKVPVEEKTAPSPKIRHYDVKEVRDYIRKKKEERQKRHQEEYKKTLQKMEKKKKDLQKLYEFQKTASLLTTKSVSPLKVQKVAEGNSNVKQTAAHKKLDIDTQNVSNTNLPLDPLDLPETVKLPTTSGAFLENPNERLLDQSNTEPKKTNNSKGKELLRMKNKKDKNEPKSKDLKMESLVSENFKETENLVKIDSLSFQAEHLDVQKKSEVSMPSTLFEHQSSNMCSYVSTISTPSQFSLSPNINDTLPEDLKYHKFTLPSNNFSKQAETLKHLVNSINQITEPYEHLMRTRAWVEQSPPPPKRKSVLKERNYDAESPKKHIHVVKDNTDFVINVAKSLQGVDGGTSFKQQVTNVGDTDELYEKILGQRTYSHDLKTSSATKKDSDKQLPTGSLVHSEQEFTLIEGSLKSEDTNLNENESNTLNEYSLIEGSLKSENSTVINKDQSFMKVQLQNDVLTPDNHMTSEFTFLGMNPDPFNFINTWNRKPLSFPGVSLRKGTTSDVASSQNSNFPYPSGSGDITDNKPYSEELFLSTSGHPSLSSDFESTSHKTDKSVEQDFNDNSQNISNHKQTSKENSDESILTYASGTQESAISECIDEKNEIENTSEQFQSKGSEINKKALSLSESSVSEAVSVIINSKNISQQSSAVSIKSDSIVMPKSPSVENVKYASGSPGKGNTSFSNLSNNKSKMEEAESSESIPDVSDMADINSSSISVNKSVTNLANLTENESEIREGLDLSVEKSPPKESKQSFLENISKVSDESDLSENDKLPSKLMNHSSVSEVSSEKELNQGDSNTEPNELESISKISSSPNTVNIDFGQPLQLTISNGVSRSLKQVHKSISLHKEEYLHTQVVTRVASEAAAAAATSAVIAVFETQKELMNRERNVLGPKAHISSSEISPHYENSSQKVTDSSVSTVIGSSRSASASEETIMDEVNENNSPLSTVKEALDLSKETASKSSSLHSSKSKFENVNNQNRGRKISGNISSPSPASLSENESLSRSIEMIANSVATSSSTLEESILSDDSFTQLTLDVVRKKTREEELRASHKLAFLKFQEKTLVENARAEMAWFESLKKKLREKGSNKKASVIKKKQKDLILRLRQERAQLRCMQEAYRSMSEKHSLFSEKQLLNEPGLLTPVIPKKKEKSHASKNISDSKAKEKDISRPQSASTSTILTEDEDRDIDEELDTVLEMPKSVASISSQGSIVETVASEQAKSSVSSNSKSHKMSPISFPQSKQGLNQSNMSLNSNNSAESALQGFKKLESSKRHLTKREQRILQRRKHVERLLQWQMKLDSEEMAVRELEQKAVELVDGSKKKTKYYVSSSPSTQVFNGDENQSAVESPELESKITENQNKCASSDRTPSSISAEIVPESTHSGSIPEENVLTITSGNSLEEVWSKKGSTDLESSAFSSSSIKEIESRNQSSESSVKTIENNTESSPIEEETTNGASSSTKSQTKQKSAPLDIYSESFESTASLKISSVENSSVILMTSPSNKKDKAFSIKTPLAPRNLRRHDSSGSDDSYTISHSETASDQSDIEVRIHALAEELRRRKHEAEKLKKEQKRKYREHLKGKELSLQKQVEAYNQYIQQIKSDLERIEAISAATTVTETSPVKPQIKWPRSEHASDSRRIRKQAALTPDTLISEKKCSETVSSPDSVESHIDISHKKEKILMKQLFPEPKEKLKFLTDSSSDIEKPFSVKDNSNHQKITPSSSVTTEKDISSEVVEILNTETSLAKAKASVLEKATGEASAKSKEDTDVEESFEISHSSIETVSSVYEKEMVPSDTQRKSINPSEFFISNSSVSQALKNSTSQKSSLHNTASDDNESHGNSLESAEEMPRDSDISTNTAVNESVHSSEAEYTSESSLNAGSIKEDFGSGDFESSDPSSVQSVQKTVDESSIAEDANNSLSASENKEISSKNVPQDANKVENESIVSNKQALNEKLKSETFVVNVVNYLYSSVFDDAIKTVLYLSRKDLSAKYINSLEGQDNKNAQRISSHSVVQKLDAAVVEKISTKLLDFYLNDAICSVINVANSFENPILMENSSLQVSVTKKAQDSSQIVFELPHQGCGDFQSSYSIVSSRNGNDNLLFNRHADWFEEGLGGSQLDSQQLEQQLVLQQYPYYYRKIPNKPPPPYTPPSALNINSSILPLKKEKPVEKIDSIEDVTKNISLVIECIADALLVQKGRGLKISDITYLDLNPIVEQLDLTVPCQLTFLDLVSDLSKEISLNVFSETEQILEPWLKPRKLTPKPLFPKDKNKLIAALHKELNHTLKLLPREPYVEQRRKRPSWSTMKLGRKKRDFVDTILISELKEEEPDWVNYDQDEVTVKFQIADSIFDILIDDTVSFIQSLDQSIFR